MTRSDLGPNVPVADRILLHLWEQDHQADHYIVSPDVTRPGIAESCALHPPNVSRAMGDLMSNGLVSEHRRTVRGESRRQKTWQLTEEGRDSARDRISSLRSVMVPIRSSDGQLLEIRADEAASKLQTGLTLLQVLMHSQHEGVLNFGDIRFGALLRKEDEIPPGSISILAGAHSTYHTHPPRTRTVHGRSREKQALKDWFDSEKPMFSLFGIAGCGKTTLVSHWLTETLEADLDLEVMYYPCQPWDSPLGIATSILHRLGIVEGKDPYGVLSSLPLRPGARINIDSYRRRLTAHLLDDEDLVGITHGEVLLILDDIHNIGSSGEHLFGALLQIAESTGIRLMMASRTNLAFYDRRDVHTRNRVEELPLSGLTLEEVTDWLEKMDLPDRAPAAQIHKATGGHPLAVELLEIYGKTLHDDWLRFLDEEILDVLPEDHRELLSLLAVADRPVTWTTLANAAGADGPPPQQLIDRGLMLELEEGLWLHEALRSRLLREVGAPHEERSRKLSQAAD
ncbi:MAG: ATP-binding protein [Candidatus Thalassarchaeaceae archaeon]|nr:ATP-binding protein [Candidatus Thalassarchaeaceae archaeon]